MNKQKGFTIIELIVVIAIIAVLASIVLVGVTKYTSKARDSSIKANMSSMITDAVLFYDDYSATGGQGGYVQGAYTVCQDNTSGFTKAFAEAEVQMKSGGTFDCDNSVAEWRAAVQINNPSSPTTKKPSAWWCVDYTGKKVELTSDPSGSATACP